MPVADGVSAETLGNLRTLSDFPDPSHKLAHARLGESPSVVPRHRLEAVAPGPRRCSPRITNNRLLRRGKAFEKEGQAVGVDMHPDRAGNVARADRVEPVAERSLRIIFADAGSPAREVQTTVWDRVFDGNPASDGLVADQAMGDVGVHGSTRLDRSGP